MNLAGKTRNNHLEIKNTKVKARTPLQELNIFFSIPSNPMAITKGNDHLSLSLSIHDTHTHTHSISFVLS